MNYINSKQNKLNYLFIEPVIKLKSWNLAKFRFSQIMHNRTNGLYSKFIWNLFKLIYPKVELPKSELLSEEQIENSVKNLRDKGWKILDFSLSKEEIDSILNFAYKNPTYGQNETEPIFFDPESPPKKQARYIWRISDLIQNSVIQKLIKDSAIHQIAQEYLGSKPILSHLTLWLDPVSENKSYQPHVYHQDTDGPKYLKFFIYITDVDENSCPHSYIQGTHSFSKNINFAETKRYSDKELLEFYGKENEITFIAPAGTVIAEDTMGFHRGTVPKIGYRLLVQFEYAIQDIPYIREYDNLESKEFQKVKIDGLDKDIQKIVKKMFY